MRKSDLIENLALQRNISVKRAEQVVKELFDAMGQSLIDGERIEVRGFGSFEMREYGGYSGRNPKTGIEVPITPRRVLTFRASQGMRQKVK